MRWLIALLLSALAASPATARQVRSYYCSVDRGEAPEMMSAYQYVSLAGVPASRSTIWVTDLAPRGITLTASWVGDGSAHVFDQNFVSFSYRPPRPGAYRIEVRRDEASAASQMRYGSRLTRPNRNGLLWFTDWRTIMAAVADAFDPHIVLLAANGRVVRRDPIDASIFDSALTRARALQPELDEMVADYRNRCRIVEGDGL